jgi:GTP pyrophosphokinase
MAQSASRGLSNTSDSVSVALVLHDGQTRRNGDPFVSHPIRVARLLFSSGVRDDVILAGSLLHDVLEECSDCVTASDLEITYRVDRSVVEIVETLTKHKGLSTSEYYAGIASSPEAAVVKIADRCHNLATMTNAFSPQKMAEYIAETQLFVFPLCNHAIRNCPEHASIIRVFKQRMEDIVCAVERTFEQSRVRDGF